jgi:hypothetical protein
MTPQADAVPVPSIQMIGPKICPPMGLREPGRKKPKLRCMGFQSETFYGKQSLNDEYRKAAVF